ncbi:MAG: histidine kinase dimerization/phospho-acceptor domain-containing protein, partial [Patescibacteria group bacterium]
MFCSDIPAPTYLIFSNSVPQLLYYSHIPVAIISLILGIFVFWKNRALISKILLTISIIFSLWLFLSLITWTNIDSRLIMLVWSFFGLLYSLIYVLSLYFVYVFIDKKDIFFFKKVLLGILILPVIFLSSTAYNLGSFDLVNCEAVEGNYYTYYYYGLGFLVFLWILVLSFIRYRKETDYEFKKQIILLTVGIELFLFSFFISGFLASYVDNFALEQYGLFGMVIFMGFLAYLIVKFKAFDIKLLAAQALVAALVILVGSQFFYVQNNTSRILTGITLILAIGFGWALIKSVKNEVRRKEELQIMSDRLAIANDQLRKLDNAKSEFISIASHQLRTPLTAIKGFVSLLLEGTYDEVSTPQREALNKIYLSCERLIQLVENLLNVSRIESGRIEYEFRKWRTEDIIKEISDSLVFAARNKGLYLNIDLPREGLPEIEVDGAKIKEVVSNLVDNAVKYTRRGGVTVRAELAPEVQSSKFSAKGGSASGGKVQSEGDFIRIT